MDGDEGSARSTLPPAEVNLQDIIMARKAQRKLKAEEKRQLGLQRIKDLNSTTGIDPLEQFPKEIWEEILNGLGPEDRENARQVHPLFSNLMEASHIGDIFLPQVLQLDIFHSWFEEPRELATADYQFTKQLRCLSKVSREYYDRWIDASFEKRMQVPDAYTTAYYNHFTFGKRKSHARLSKFLANFGDGKNPARRFFPRGFSVSFTEDHISIPLPQEDPDREEFLQELRTTFRNKIEAALSIVGDQIWHFRFFINDYEMTPSSFAEIYALFKRLISLLPNLRWLEFSVGGEENTDQPPERSTKINFLKDNPFPYVASLERLTFHYDLYHENMDACQVELFGAVIDANPQINILDLNDADDANLRDLQNHEIQSLAHLTSFSQTHIKGHGQSLGFIERMVNLSWPLKSIYLDLNTEGMALNYLFRFLNNFPTLENLELFQGHYILYTDAWEYLELPNLRNLDLPVECPGIDYDSNNINFFFSLQFLVHCEKLKTLSWSLYRFDEIKLRNNLRTHEIPGKTIDFRAGLRVLYDSNIWDVFPGLQSCNVRLCKSRYETENVLLKWTETCTHEYRRLVPGKKMSIGEFLKSHKCCRNDYGLHNCVVLVD